MEKPTERQTLSSVADTVLSKDVTFEVEILHPSRLQKWRKETKRAFKIGPSTLGTMIKISKEFLQVEINDYDKENVLESNYILVKEHAERMALIVAYAVKNSKEDPPKSLINFFLNNLTAKELSDLVVIIVQQIDVVNFLRSIISARGMQILSKMNPKEQGSKIASGE